jgi:hypothetical protein
MIEQIIIPFPEQIGLDDKHLFVQREAIHTTVYIEYQLPDVIEDGRKAWNVLHNKQNPSPEWFYGVWYLMIPRMCSCINHFTTLIQEYPPDFSSPEAFWLWGWFVHNKINNRLHKPDFSLQDACSLYGRDYAVLSTLPIPRRNEPMCHTITSV